jgi:hypothetical protein
MVVSEIQTEDIVAKLPRPIYSGRAARTATLKYCSVNLLRKELCRQRERERERERVRERVSVCFYGH